MPQLPHLPPVAQGVLALSAVAIAVVRLLTASRPFWSTTPAWAQKLLPALLMAVAAVPTAIEHARTWLDVLVAFVVSAAMFYTASRGDKRPAEPPKSDPGSGVDDAVSLMPEPVKLVAQDRSRLHNDIPDEPAEFRRWDYPALRATWALRLCAGLLVGFVLGSLLVPVTGCSALRSVTPADRAEAYAGQAKAAELACKAYTFDLAAGLTPDVPAMTKLCAGE